MTLDVAAQALTNDTNKNFRLFFISYSLSRYDVILSSETIYCRENYSKLHNIMEATLKTTGRMYPEI